MQQSYIFIHTINETPRLMVRSPAFFLLAAWMPLNDR